MTAFPEQVRRDAEQLQEFLRHAEYFDSEDGADQYADSIAALNRIVARLEQAERERDEATKAYDDQYERTCAEEERADAAEARLASVPALVEATRDYQRDADWYRRCLEGIQDRKPVRGLAEAKAAFDSSRDRLAAALTVYEQSQGNTE